MAFEVNDMVQYGATGICKITGIEKKQIMGREKAYFVLQPMFDKGSAVYVPTDSQPLLSKMRRVLSPDEIYALIQSIPGAEDIWIENYKAILEYSEEMIRLSNDICIYGQNLSVEEITSDDILIIGKIKNIEFE